MTAGAPLSEGELDTLSVKAPGDVEDVEDGRDLVPLVHRMVDEIRGRREALQRLHVAVRREMAATTERRDRTLLSFDADPKHVGGLNGRVDALDWVLQRIDEDSA